jgi:hypothetical protein
MRAWHVRALLLFSNLRLELTSDIDHRKCHSTLCSRFVMGEFQTERQVLSGLAKRHLTPLQRTTPLRALVSSVIGLQLSVAEFFPKHTRVCFQVLLHRQPLTSLRLLTAWPLCVFSFCPCPLTLSPASWSFVGHGRALTLCPASFSSWQKPNLEDIRLSWVLASPSRLLPLSLLSYRGTLILAVFSFALSWVQDP